MADVIRAQPSVVVNPAAPAVTVHTPAVRNEIVVQPATAPEVRNEITVQPSAAPEVRDVINITQSEITPCGAETHINQPATEQPCS